MCGFRSHGYALRQSPRALPLVYPNLSKAYHINTLLNQASSYLTGA